MLIFTDNVNNVPQAVLNEINVAAGSNVTIVPFRLAAVDFSSELHFYLGRMHWLDAFPPPLDAHLEVLTETILRNLKRPPAAANAAPPAASAAAAAPPLPPPVGLAPPHPARPPRPATESRPGLDSRRLAGGAVPGLLLIVIGLAAAARSGAGPGRQLPRSCKVRRQRDRQERRRQRRR